MGRYREVMAPNIAKGDTSGAGLAAWRAWRAERSAWRRARGLTWPEAREVLGPVHGPDFGWIMREYGLPAPRWGADETP